MFRLFSWRGENCIDLEEFGVFRLCVCVCVCVSENLEKKWRKWLVSLSLSLVQRLELHPSRDVVVCILPSIFFCSTTASGEIKCIYFYRSRIQVVRNTLSNKRVKEYIQQWRRERERERYITARVSHIIFEIDATRQIPVCLFVSK
jgi:hypothetical protein